MRIGVDLLGGETPPQKLFEAVLQAVQQLPHAQFRVYGPVDSVPQVEVVSTTQAITAEDDPLQVIHTQTSMNLGLRDLQSGQIDAFISIGNTAALVAGSVLTLEKIPGVLRPGLLALLPTRKGVLAVIDVGANVLCKANYLVQFAKLGVAYLRTQYQIDNPKVGLLNIGVESQKGRVELREAYALLQQTSLNFVGNIEGTVAFEGDVDVLVTDGFSGNVFLKASEGMASFIYEVGGLEPRFNYEEYPGALLCGLDRIVIKCHGNSGPNSLLHAILGAASYLQNDLISKMIILD